jgi:PilZ domain
VVTFLVNIEGRILRFGFPARLMDLITDYQIASGNDVEALRINKYADPEPVDFRMYFRVRLPSQSGLSLFLREEKVNLLDISIGGAKFTYPKSYIFRPADLVKCVLVIGDAIFKVNAKVRSVVTSTTATANRNLQHVAVEFNHNDKKLEASLGKAILDIERELLSEGRI